MSDGTFLNISKKSILQKIKLKLRLKFILSVEFVMK